MKYLYGVRCSYQGCGNTLPAKGWLKIGEYCYCDERCAARDSKLRNNEEVLDVTKNRGRLTMKGTFEPDGPLWEHVNGMSYPTYIASSSIDGKTAWPVYLVIDGEKNGADIRSA